jgi:hypothetical protein
MYKIKNALASMAVVVGFLVLAVGSGSVPQQTTDMTASPISGGIFTNKNLTIFAQNDAFKIEGGERFATPFDAYIWGGSPMFAAFSGEIVNNVDAALSTGAGQRVTIYQEGETEPLYGVLVFNQAIAAAYGPASRSYFLQIPEDKIAAAKGGVTAVAYEKMSWKSTWSNGAKGDSFSYSWVLWMSSYPF